MRRHALASLALCALLVGAGCLAGTGGPRHPPSGPADERVTDRPADPDGDGVDGAEPTTTTSEPTHVAVRGHSFQQGDLGDVVLNLSVRNNDTAARRAQLVGVLEHNGSTRRVWKQAVVQPGETGFVELYFDIPWSMFDGNLTEARVVWTQPETTD